jgi:hypothetical protein
MLNLFCHTVGVKHLNGSHELSMERTPSLVEQRVIGYLIRKAMLESILKLRE